MTGIIPCPLPHISQTRPVHGDAPDAFRDAELLVEALDAGLAGRRPLDLALAEYERRRNQATTAQYRENLALAQFNPFPVELTRLRAALRGNQAATNQFYLAREGMIPGEAFFNPENLQRLLAAAHGNGNGSPG